VAALLVGVVVCVTRGRVRSVARIERNDCSDCAVAFLCAPCAVCQLFVETGLDFDDAARPYRSPCDEVGDGGAWV